MVATTCDDNRLTFLRHANLTVNDACIRYPTVLWPLQKSIKTRIDVILNGPARLLDYYNDLLDNENENSSEISVIIPTSTRTDIHTTNVSSSLQSVPDEDALYYEVCEDDFLLIPVNRHSTPAINSGDSVRALVLDLLSAMEDRAFGTAQTRQNVAISMRRGVYQADIVLVRPWKSGESFQLRFVFGRKRCRTMNE